MSEYTEPGWLHEITGGVEPHEDPYVNNVELNPNLHPGQFGGKSVKRISGTFTSQGHEQLLSVEGGEPKWYGPAAFHTLKNYGRERKIVGI